MTVLINKTMDQEDLLGTLKFLITYKIMIATLVHIGATSFNTVP